MESKQRLHLIDTFRGLCLISMILYHAYYDCVYIFHIHFSISNTLTYIWQQSICWSFIFLSGFSFSLGKHHVKRGIILLLCGYVIELITTLLVPNESVRFGILTFMGFATLIMIPFEKILAGIPSKIGLPATLSLFFLFRNVNHHFLGFEGINLLPLNDLLYANTFTTLLGFPYPHFVSSDYFSLFPWIFLYISGYFLWKTINSSLKDHTILVKKVPIISSIGRHTLPIYMVHQPILMGILTLLDILNVF